MSALLRALGVLAWYLGLARLIRWLNGDVPRVLAYHACDATESSFTAGLRCNTRPDVLRQQLDHLAEAYSVVPIEQLEEGHAIPRPVVITFDDGYRSVYEHAFPLMRERGMSGLVFLVGCTGPGTRLIWVNELNWLLREHPTSLDVVVERYALSRNASIADVMTHVQATETPSGVESLLEDLARRYHIDRAALAREAALYLSGRQVEEMRRAGFSFGNHTFSHPNLTRLSEDECRDEIERGRAIPTGNGAPIATRPSFAYPFGLHSETARRVAQAVGHRTIMKIGGWNRPLDLTRLSRIPVYATTPAEFFAELEIVHPIKAWVRRVLARTASMRGSSA